MKFALEIIYSLLLVAYASLTSYNLAKPDRIITLPPVLHEISGITMPGLSLVACIQDEDGIVFTYDIETNKIASQRAFHTPGDYEGIAHKGKTLFILRSDGSIFEVADYTSPKSKVSSYKTDIPAKECEGLCLDQKNNRLLIAPKGRTEDEKDKNKRKIYAFDLATRKLQKQPAMVLDVKDLEAFALKNNPELVKKTKDGKKKEPEIALETSAIAIHPLTGRLYLVSSADNLLFVFNSDGTVEKIIKLEKKLFPQPEGITFLPDGDMFISNEGGSGAATLLRFDHK